MLLTSNMQCWSIALRLEALGEWKGQKACDWNAIWKKTFFISLTSVTYKTEEAGHRCFLLLISYTSRCHIVLKLTCQIKAEGQKRDFWSVCLFVFFVILTKSLKLQHPGSGCICGSLMASLIPQQFQGSSQDGLLESLDLRPWPSRSACKVSRVSTCSWNALLFSLPSRGK